MPIVRPATAHDAVAIAHIEAAAWRAAYAGLVPAPQLAALGSAHRVDRWHRRIDGGHLIRVAAVGARVDGYTTFGLARGARDGFAGQIYELYVDPRRQRRGVGRALLAQGWAELESRGLLWGIVEVLRDNTAARRFYEACGLQTTGRPLRRRQHLWRAPAGARHRYSGTHSDVVVVRYERPLNALQI